MNVIFTIDLSLWNVQRQSDTNANKDNVCTGHRV